MFRKFADFVCSVVVVVAMLPVWLLMYPVTLIISAPGLYRERERRKKMLRGRIFRMDFTAANLSREDMDFLLEIFSKRIVWLGGSINDAEGGDVIVMKRVVTDEEERFFGASDVEYRIYVGPKWIATWRESEVPHFTAYKSREKFLIEFQVDEALSKIKCE